MDRPALFTRMSTRPCWAITSATSLSIASRSVRSQGCSALCQPTASTSAAVARSFSSPRATSSTVRPPPKRQRGRLADPGVLRGDQHDLVAHRVRQRRVAAQGAHDRVWGDSAPGFVEAPLSAPTGLRAVRPPVSKDSFLDPVVGRTVLPEGSAHLIASGTSSGRDHPPVKRFVRWAGGSVLTLSCWRGGWGSDQTYQAIIALRRQLGTSVHECACDARASAPPECRHAHR